jgi:biopolymer transport protein ExbD
LARSVAPGKRGEINITPMIDVLLVLFMIVMATCRRRSAVSTSTCRRKTPVEPRATPPTQIVLSYSAPA